MALRTAVLISGRGSNMVALIEAARAADYPADIVLVVSNRPTAPGLDLARGHGIEARTVDHTAHDSQEDFEDALDAELKAAGIELVCLAGFMRLLSRGFVERWQDRLINIHPSLLPAFRGIDTHTRALAAGVRISGCTVHYVSAEMDAGPIIAQAAVPVLPGDTADDLARRVLRAEHRLYPLALRLVASGRARVVSGRVIVEARGEDGTLFSPAP